MDIKAMETSKKPATATKKMQKVLMTNQLFSEKTLKPVPEKILNHKLFKEPIKVKKIFPAIGLSNFKEDCNIVIPSVDLKRNDNFVTLLIKALHRELGIAKESVDTSINRINYFLVGKEREENLNKIDSFCNCKVILSGLYKQVDVVNTPAEKIVQTVSGKIALKLANGITDINGKVIYKKDVNIFKVYSALQKQLNDIGITLTNLDDIREFKTFGTENVPNKTFSVVFTSDGRDGAWDLLTMSMRGIKSCQRWGGEHDQCLTGSIISKYVGIMYLTSGSDFEGYGSKMIRRSIVRYVIDTTTQKPAILIDKMYPEDNEETLKVFTDKIKEKTGLPVHYAPRVKNKCKNFYIPSEKNREVIPEREWSYADTPIKTNIEYNLYVLGLNPMDDLNRYITTLRHKAISALSEELRNILYTGKKDQKDNYKMIYNIRVANQLDKFCDQFVNDIMNAYNPGIKFDAEPKIYYKEYLKSLVLKEKDIKQISNNRVITTYLGDEFSDKEKTDFKNSLIRILCQFFKKELIAQFN